MTNIRPPSEPGKNTPIELDAKPDTEQREREHQERLAVIGTHIMRALGKPDDLHRVQVRHLWGDHYRVNVFVGGDAATAKIAHSYFLVADSGGAISASTPAITRQYHAPTSAC
ncbi:hypothetical protein AYO44_10175 [Planctomycetaceae bacterium SCGC AG-212-F19]|nr:hypothetical protein AYO44_10175 [Planctomycetaceae bacterium SCGC AG-212-F19]